jgi:hypothetical protein
MLRCFYCQELSYKPQWLRAFISSTTVVPHAHLSTLVWLFWLRRRETFLSFYCYIFLSFADEMSFVTSSTAAVTPYLGPSAAATSAAASLNGGFSTCSPVLIYCWIGNGIDEASGSCFVCPDGAPPGWDWEWSNSCIDARCAPTVTDSIQCCFCPTTPTPTHSSIPLYTSSVSLYLVIALLRNISSSMD